MENHGINLNMTMSNMSVINGKIKSISDGIDEDYVTKIEMVLSALEYEFPVGMYSDNYDGSLVEIKISSITKKKDDPIYSVAKKLDLEVDNPGLVPIPFEAFTDNRGEYPAFLLQILFYKRIASWTDGTHETGVKVNLDYEKMQIIGAPVNEEKVKAITVINRLIKSQKWDIKNIRYDNVTVFLETYFKKPSDEVLLLKLNALVSETAYKTSVCDYLLPKTSGSDAVGSLVDFEKSHSCEDINKEEDLLFIVEKAINDVLKHEIESRRWIEPFWDGQRKIKHKDSDQLVPNEPKSETKIQPTLHVILHLTLSPLGIQVIRESDEGIGSLDFRFLYTTKDRVPLTVGMEFKIAHHKEIEKGISKQLPAYLKAIRSSSGIFVVMWFKDKKFFRKPKSYEKNDMESWLFEQAAIVSKEKNINISATMLDASIRPSASNL